MLYFVAPTHPSSALRSPLRYLPQLARQVVAERWASMDTKTQSNVNTNLDLGRETSPFSGLPCNGAPVSGLWDGLLTYSA